MVGMTRAHMADPHIARKIAAGREARDPPLRRHGLLHRLDLYRRGGLHPQRRDRARGDDAARDRALDRAAATGRRGRRRARAGSRRRGSRPSAATRCVVLEAAAEPGGQIRLAAGAQAAARDHRHRRLAHARMRAARRRVPLQPSRRGRRRARPRRRTSSSSPPAALPNIGFLDAGEELWRPALGHPVRRREAGRRGDPLRRQRRPSRHDRGRVHRRVRRDARDRDAGADARAPMSAARIYPPYFKRLQPRTASKVTLNLRLTDRAPGQPRSPASSTTNTAERADREGWPTRSSSSTARCRSTSSISRSRPARAISARSITRALLAGRPQTVATNPDGALRLFRIGDAVASRNIHAAVYDALRLMKDV